MQGQRTRKQLPLCDQLMITHFIRRWLVVVLGPALIRHHDKSPCPTAISHCVRRAARALFGLWPLCTRQCIFLPSVGRGGGVYVLKSGAATALSRNRNSSIKHTLRDISGSELRAYGSLRKYIYEAGISWHDIMYRLDRDSTQ